jgi:hypothetical protein
LLLVYVKGTIGEGAYDTEGHRNTTFLEAKMVGAYPREMQQAWTKIRNEAIANYGIEGEEGAEQWDILGPLAETTPAMARNIGAAGRRRERRAEVFMTQPEARQNGRHNGNQGQQDRHEEHAEEEDFEGFMETVAEAVRAAERDAEASHAARDREGATVVEMRDEERPRGTEETGDNICLHETTTTALGSPANAREQRRQQMGKAPADTVGTSTPAMERRQHATPATQRYRRDADPTNQRQSQRPETSRAAAKETGQRQPNVKYTPWGLWSAVGKMKKDLNLTQGSACQRQWTTSDGT